MNHARRTYLRRTVVGIAGMALGTRPAIGFGQRGTERKRLLRVAHITDIHVQPELGAGEGLVKCLRHLHAQPDPVDLIINTGDTVMDCLAHNAERVHLIWDLWQSIVAKELHHPIRYAIGNHDIWGWDKKASQTTGAEPGWGKALALNRLGMESPYYSFDHAGWHFVALDTVQQAQDHYRAFIDDVQFDWLSKDLGAVDSKTPILVFTHIPIIGVAPLLNNDAAATGDFIVPGSKIVVDNVKVKNLFKRFPNIRVCLSGHIHLIDQVEYLGITYLCGGAVCGDYWKGVRNGECDAGYSVIDLYDDGSANRTYYTYGWAYRS